MKVLSFTTAIVVGLFLALGAPAWSAKGPKGAELVKDATITIDQAIKTASEKVQGPVGEAELKRKDGKTIWEVEIAAADSKVMKVHVDAQTGGVIGTEEKKPRKAEREHKTKAKGKEKKD